MSIPLIVLGYIVFTMARNLIRRRTVTESLDGLFQSAAALTADAMLAMALGEPAFTTLTLFGLAAVCLAGWHVILAHEPTTIEETTAP